MSVEFICDGCGKRASGTNRFGSHFKPSDWYERGDDDGSQLACSRECVKRIAAKTGKPDTVLPF